jgi:hypothetical protein
VEDFLAQFAKLINLETSKLLTGYGYLDEQKANSEIRIHFAQKDKKKPAELGLTKFSMMAQSGLDYVKRGEQLVREWIVTNEGDSSNGLDIIIAGECIDNNLLIPDLAKVKFLRPQADMQNEFSASFIETTSTTGEKIFYARIEGITIPKGYQPTFPLTPKESKQYYQNRYACAVKINIILIGSKEGAGEYTIFFCPLANRQEGSFSRTLKTSIT